MRIYILPLIILCYFSLLSQQGYAQDPNPILAKDSLDRKKDTTLHPPDSVYHTILSSTGSINNANNIVTYLLNNNLKFEVKKKSISLSFDNNWVYGKDNNSLTNNDYSSTLQFNLYKSIPHFAYWGLANYNTSYSLKINSQLLAGYGVAYSIYDRKNAYLNFSDGLIYDNSDLILPESSRLVYHTVRNSFRISFKFSVENIFIVDGTDFLQNSLDLGSDYIIKSITNLSFKLNKWINLTSSLNYNLQKRTASSNLLFTYGLKIDQYF
jgi:hypothetical protein